MFLNEKKVLFVIGFRSLYAAFQAGFWASKSNLAILLLNLATFHTTLATFSSKRT